MYVERYNQRDSTPTVDIAERRLWLAIIAQALSDAKYRGTTLQELVEKKKAIVWLEKGSIESPKWLLNVCHLAGYDYTYVKENIYFFFDYLYSCREFNSEVFEIFLHKKEHQKNFFQFFPSWIKYNL